MAWDEAGVTGSEKAIENLDIDICPEITGRLLLSLQQDSNRNMFLKIAMD